MMIQVAINLPGLDVSHLVDFDVNEDFEVFQYQVLSLQNEYTDLVLLDKSGREVTSTSHLLDILTSDLSSSIQKAELWCLNTKFSHLETFCSNNCFPDESLVQPRYSIADMDILLCSRCRFLIDGDMVSVGNTMLMSFECKCKQLLEMGFAYPTAQQALQSEKEDFLNNKVLSSLPYYLYMKRLALEQAIKSVTAPPNSVSVAHSFRSRLSSGLKTIKVYEDAEQQYSARQCVDFGKVQQYITEQKEQQRLQQLNQSTDSSVPAAKTLSEDEMVMVALMRWFKCDHFKWCNKPRCASSSCQDLPNRLEGTGVSEPSALEREVGWAGRTELYTCGHCQQITRFPRYNNPSYLLRHSPTGRCGEFANAFCLLCRSLGIDARYVLDFTDHVWVEVWIPSLKRFVHCDPCERALDSPMMYEAGWNKKLSHILSFSRYGVEDASPRYSRKLGELVVSRSAEILFEGSAREVISSMDAELESYFRSKWSVPLTGQEMSLTDRIALGAAGFETAVTGYDISVDVMLERKRLQRRELLGLSMQTALSLKVEEQRGRISGDADWKLSRGEIKPSEANVTTEKCDDKGDCGTTAVAENTVEDEVTRRFLSRCTTGQVTVLMKSAATANGKLGVEAKSILGALSTLYADYCTDTTLINGIEKCLSCPLASADRVLYSTHRLQHNAHHSASQQSISDQPVIGYSCSVPCGILFRATDSGGVATESEADFLTRVTTQCDQSSHLLGYSVSGGDSCTHAVLFSDAGFPLRKAVNVKTFVRAATDEIETADPSAQRSLSVSKYYLSLGGGHHGDTQYFDSSHFLDSLLPTVSSLRLSKLIVWAGDSIVNGVQTFYSGTDLTTNQSFELASPPYTSKHDNPRPHTFVVDPDDRVVSVTVRSGSLIDSITLRTLKGHCFRAGGNGGGESAILDVPENTTIFGFFGGLGGHLHNIGIVLGCTHNNASSTSVVAPAIPGSSVSSVSRLSLLALSTELGMWDCGWLNHAASNDTESNCCVQQRHAEVGRLIELTLAVVSQNAPAEARTCLSAIAMYLDNKAKDLRNPKTQVVRLANPYFKKTVLSVIGGLELFCFGPGRFSLSGDLLTLDSCSAHATILADSERSAQYKVALVKYVKYLHAVVGKL